ncbi:sigma factor [Niameybacter massiliensis]|uniref:sigma factor n=1 Tax=Niameybacter massiliensis TaxID=1658108 RepID=UPI0006B5B712|nr:sigma factor [Niameybacter massiliensis]
MQINISVHNKIYTDADDLIEDYIPFIVKVISSITHRYVSIENDEEFSIGLSSFYEAICKYDAHKGDFLPFAQLVIRSRLLNYLNSEKKHAILDSLDTEQAINIGQLKVEYLETTLDGVDLVAEEVQVLTTVLQDFKFDLVSLCTEAPKHEKTRTNAIDISEKVSKDQPLVDLMYLKKRLPITRISLKYNITQKILKGSKKFIITVIIIFDKNLRNLKLWIRK